MTELREKLVAEALRIEEDTDYSARSHYNAASAWSNCHLWFGLPAVLVGAIAAASGFAENTIVASVLATISTSLTAVLTFIKPSERSENHKAIAAQYHALRNKARLYREIELTLANDLDIAREKLLKFSSERDDLNQRAPTPARRHFVQARRDIEAGTTQYAVDRE